VAVKQLAEDFARYTWPRHRFGFFLPKIW